MTDHLPDRTSLAADHARQVAAARGVLSHRPEFVAGSYLVGPGDRVDAVLADLWGELETEAWAVLAEMVAEANESADGWKPVFSDPVHTVTAVTRGMCPTTRCFNTEAPVLPGDSMLLVTMTSVARFVPISADPGETPAP